MTTRNFYTNFMNLREWKRRLALISVSICALCFLPSALAQRVTASITITNATTNGMTLTLNGDTRTFTNNVVNPATQIGTNNDVTGCGSATNAFFQIQIAPFSQVVIHAGGTNSFTLVGNSGLPMAATLSTGLGIVSYSTQTVATLTAVRVPVSGEPSAAVQTNVASGLVAAINSPQNTNAIDQNATVAAQLLGTTKSQTASGATTLNNTNNHIFGIISSLGISGNSVLMTNGLYFTPIFLNPVMTNGINYGNAFSSPGTNGTNPEQFGFHALANGDSSLAIGATATAIGNNTIAIGNSLSGGFGSITVGVGANTTSDNSTAVGGSATATGTNSTALGANTISTATASTAIGEAADAEFNNSTAIGTGSTTTQTNQIMLGAPGISTVVQNHLTVQANEVVAGNFNAAGLTTNQTWTGTNTFGNGADIAFTRKAVSSLAIGNNAAVPIGTNEFIEVSGPSGSFAINGIASGRDGKLITVLNQTGFQMTIANESGTDPTAANRIRTLGAAADLVLTNAAVTLQYNASVTRWIVISHNP